jgi:hypothetical protein
MGHVWMTMRTVLEIELMSGLVEMHV